MKGLATLVLATVVILLARCAADAPEGAAPPDPEVGGMEPQVVELLLQAREALLREPSAEHWGEFGAVLDAHGLLEDAEVCYRQAQESARDDFRWTYLLAVVREIRGAETTEVRQLFGRAATMRADYAPIYMRLGYALSLRGDHDGAGEAFEQAIRLAPESAVAHRGMGQALLAAGDLDGALRHLQHAVQSEPRDLSAYSGLAQVYMRQRREELAREAVERSRGLQPINAFDDPVYGEQVFMRSMSSSRAFKRAQAAIRIGAYTQAVDDLQIVLRVRPDDASAHFWLGTAHQGLGQMDPAVEYLSRAIELEPGMVPARLRLATLLLRGQRFEEAEMQYRRAAELKPLDADGHYGLGLALEALGRTAAARKEFEAAAAAKARP